MAFDGFDAEAQFGAICLLAFPSANELEHLRLA